MTCFSSAGAVKSLHEHKCRNMQVRACARSAIGRPGETSLHSHRGDDRCLVSVGVWSFYLGKGLEDPSTSLDLGAGRVRIMDCVHVRRRGSEERIAPRVRVAQGRVEFRNGRGNGE